MTQGDVGSSAASEAAPRRRTGLLLVAVVLALAGMPLYMQTIDHPFLRRTGLATFVPMALGALLGWYAQIGDRRLWARALGWTPAALTVLSVIMFFVLTALPTARVATAGTAQNFTLPDHTGQSVALADKLAAGPVLLVFYRGFW